MSLIRTLLVALVLVAAAGSFVIAADPPAGDGDSAATEFDKVFGQWKDLLAKMRDIQSQHATAKGDDKAKLESEYNDLIAQGRKLAPQLVEVAELAYKAAQGKSKQITEFIMNNFNDALRVDRYEEAARLGKLLVDNGERDRRIFTESARAAMTVNDYDSARKYVKLAQEDGDRSEATSQLLKKIDETEPLWKQEQKIRAAEDKADDLPRVKFATSKGDIVLELFENEAPNTVANLISLVEKGFYDGIKFHRVLPGFMAQGGDPEGTGGGGPGYTIADEVGPGYRHHFRGSLSMAKTAAPNSGGSQFFLTFVRTEHLDGLHTVFGRVIEGTDVLSKLTRIEPGRGGGSSPDKIIKATVLRKRKHEYKPVVKKD